uniref:Bidirectional sugar transporter SWEET n=1 Tax=Betula platyphylla TaxID=78630 RepID=A0AA96Q939_BETPL|nr:SWEET1a protein [Betula platyphylla]
MEAKTGEDKSSSRTSMAHSFAHGSLIFLPQYMLSKGLYGNAAALLLFLAPCTYRGEPSLLLCDSFLSQNRIDMDRPIGLEPACYSITIKRIIKHKSTEEFSGIPYLMSLLSCLLFGWYGLPFVSSHNLLLSTICGTGAAIEFIYVVIFMLYSRKKQKAWILLILTFVLTVFSAVALVSLFALRGKTRKLICGFAATIFNIIMYASPLSIMGTVIRTKSVEFMPFFLSLCVFLSGTSWFFYGLLGRDPFVVVSNGFGCCLGAMQLILYFTYRDSNKSTTEESVEMGLSKPHHQEKQSTANGAHQGHD